MAPTGDVLLPQAWPRGSSRVFGRHEARREGPLLITVLVVASLQSIACSPAPRVESMIETIVREYGRSEDTVSWRDLLQEMMADPINAACSLVAGLHPVAVRAIAGNVPPDNPDALEVVWRLRALRLVTGCLDFRAPTKERPTHPEDAGRQFLEAHGPDRIPFFATWMSRDRVFLAPADTQNAIVEQWQSWYTGNGMSFAYRACESVDDWYF